MNDVLDGESNEPEATLRAVREAKKNGLVLFAIGVGQGQNANELNAIASQPKCMRRYSLEEFEDLSEGARDL